MKLSKSNEMARASLAAVLLASSLGLASCGGSGEQVQKFQATRILAFGDETSVITPTGAKYSVNALLSGSNALDCASNPIWIQSIASAYNLAFPQCNPSLLTNTDSQIFATKGAMVADLSTQIDAALTNGGFGTGDMATVLVGGNDIIALFQQYPTSSLDEVTAAVVAAGVQYGTQVNRIAAFGAKVIVSTTPDMGLTPYAGDRSAGSPNGNPAILSALSNAFNDSMLKTITNDGHKIGLVQLDQYLESADRLTQAGTPSAFVNTTDASCAAAAPLPTCSTATLVANAIGASWLWADDRHLSASGQASLASLAVTRAQNNPF